MNVFICLTPLHFYFAYSIASMLHETDNSRSEIVVKGNYDFRNTSNKDFISITYIKNGDLIDKIKCKLQTSLFWRICRFKKVLLGEVRKLYVFNFNDPLTKRAIQSVSSTAEVIYTEEGIGSWNHQWSGSKPPKRVDVALMGEPEMFKTQHKDFQGVVKKLEYERVFTNTCSSNFTNMFISESFPSDVFYLYLGIPDGEVIETSAEIAVLEKIMEVIPKEKKFFIKKHPRDRDGKYAAFISRHENVEALDDKYKDIPVECLIWSSNILCVFSIISSASFYLPIIKPNIKSIFLFDLEIMPRIGTKEENIFSVKDYERFQQLVKENRNSFCPKNIVELSKLL